MEGQLPRYALLCPGLARWEAGLRRVWGCLASKALRKAAEAVLRHSMAQPELSTGVSSAIRGHKAPTAFMVVWCAAGHVAGFSLGNAGFCSWPNGLLLYFVGQDNILRDSANFFVQSGSGNLSAGTSWWLVCSGTLNSAVRIANSLRLLDIDLQRPPAFLPR